MSKFGHWLKNYLTHPSTRLHWGRVGVLLIPFLALAKPAAAIAPVAIGAGVLGLAFVLPTIFNAVIGLVVGVLISIINTLSGMLVAIIDYLILPGQRSLLFSPEIQGVWEWMQIAANVLFFAAIFIFAIMIITRQGGYNFKKAINALAIGVIMANLSYKIVLMVVEIGDSLTASAHTFFSSTGSTFGGIGPMWETLFMGQGWDTMLTIENGTFSSGASAVEYLMLALAMLAVSAIGLWVFFRLTFILIERAIRIVLTAIFGPVMFALSIIPYPELQKMGTNWWSDLIRWVLVLPLTYIYIGLANKLMPTDGTPMFQQIIDATNGATGVTNVGQFMYLIIPIAILFAAGNVPQMLNISISAVTKAIGGWSQNQLKFAGLTGLKLGGLALGGTKVGQWAWGQYGKVAAQRRGLAGVSTAFKKEATRRANMASIQQADRSKLAYRRAALQDIGISTSGKNETEVNGLWKGAQDNPEQKAALKESTKNPRIKVLEDLATLNDLESLKALGELIRETVEFHKKPKTLTNDIKNAVKDYLEAIAKGDMATASAARVEATIAAKALETQALSPGTSLESTPVYNGLMDKTVAEDKEGRNYWEVLDSMVPDKMQLREEIKKRGDRGGAAVLEDEDEDVNGNGFVAGGARPQRMSSESRLAAEAEHTQKAAEATEAREASKQTLGAGADALLDRLGARDEKIDSPEVAQALGELAKAAPENREQILATLRELGDIFHLQLNKDDGTERIDEIQRDEKLDPGDKGIAIGEVLDKSLKGTVSEGAIRGLIDVLVKDGLSIKALPGLKSVIGEVDKMPAAQQTSAWQLVEADTMAKLHAREAERMRTETVQTSASDAMKEAVTNRPESADAIRELAEEIRKAILDVMAKAPKGQGAKMAGMTIAEARKNPHYLLELLQLSALKKIAQQTHALADNELSISNFGDIPLGTGGDPGKRGEVISAMEQKVPLVEYYRLANEVLNSLPKKQ
ncbi:MAG: hypothetical protein V1826_02305 [bacterium]